MKLNHHIIIIIIVIICTVTSASSCWWVVASRAGDLVEEALVEVVSNEIDKRKESEISTPTPVKVQNVKLVDEEITKIIGYSKIPAKNCQGENTLRTNESFSKSTTVEYTFEGNGGLTLGFPGAISASIGGEIGYSSGETINRSFSFEVDILPNSYLEYKLIWLEVWQKGVATVLKSNGASEEIKFEVKNSIRYEIDAVNEIGCN